VRCCQCLCVVESSLRCCSRRRGCVVVCGLQVGAPCYFIFMECVLSTAEQRLTLIVYRTGGSATDRKCNSPLLGIIVHPVTFLVLELALLFRPSHETPSSSHVVNPHACEVKCGAALTSDMYLWTVTPPHSSVNRMHNQHISAGENSSACSVSSRPPGQIHALYTSTRLQRPVSSGPVEPYYMGTSHFDPASEDSPLLLKGAGVNDKQDV